MSKHAAKEELAPQESAEELQEALQQNNLLAEREETALAEYTDGEAEMLNFIDSMEEFLQTPFVQPTALAQNGTVFTIHKVGTRIGEKVGTNPPQEVTQLIYLIELQEPIEYLNKSREHKAFAAGDYVVLALQENKVRKQVWQRIQDVLEKESYIPNMTVKEIRPSKRAAAAGLGPSIGICHKSQWTSLTA